MRNILITIERQKREIKIYLFCLLLSFGLNLFAIIFYQTEWKELYTQGVWVLVLSFAFYFFFIIVRLPFYLFRKQKDR